MEVEEEEEEDEDVEEDEDEDVEEDEDEDVEEDDVEEEHRSPDWEAHFVRACAVEMHMDMSQEVRNFTGMMPDPYPGANILCEPAQSK